MWGGVLTPLLVSCVTWAAPNHRQQVIKKTWLEPTWWRAEAFSPWMLSPGARSPQGPNPNSASDKLGDPGRHFPL